MPNTLSTQILSYPINKHPEYPGLLFEMNLHNKKLCFPFLLITTLLLCPACSDNLTPETGIEIQGFTMGTSYAISVNEPEIKLDKGILKDTIDALLIDINQAMSTYINDSELMQLNNNRSTDWIKISPPLFEVIETAQNISRDSDGAFDVTIGPVINLWGFGRQEEQHIPEQDQLNRLILNTGYTLLELDKDKSAIRKKKPEIFIDLSAIAKGYAVDQLAKVLEQHHINNYLVEIGGEIRAKGKNNSGSAWQIGIEKPLTSDRRIENIVSLEDMALATSGDYRNYFESDGKRYSHIIDPKTAYPINHKLVSVTVLHPSCMVADAFATAILTLGPEKGMQLAEKQNLPALLISSNTDNFVQQSSTALQNLWKP